MLADFDRRWLAGILVLLILGFAAGIRYQVINESNNSEEKILINNIKETTDPEVGNGEEQEVSLIQVYVGGAVEKPGIYEVEAGSRVHEVVEMAASLEGAELIYLGMARELLDGETIIVPATGEAVGISAADTGAGQLPANKSKVNINRATAEELATELSGIGSVLAQRIVDYRSKHGLFEKIEDLQQVSGIGEKKFNDIKDCICVR